MKVIFLKDNVAFIRENYRTIERDANKMQVYLTLRINAGTVVTEALQNLEFMAINMVITKAQDPDLWVQLKDTTRDEFITFIYNTLIEYRPKIFRYKELEILVRNYLEDPNNNGDPSALISSWSQEDQTLYATMPLKRRSGLADLLFFLDAAENNEIFSSFTLRDL